MGKRTDSDTPTRAKALRVGQKLLQRHGFNGFSFQHIADDLGIKKPSLYEHFKTKEILGVEMIAEYHRSFAQWTKTIEMFDPIDQLSALFELYYRFSTNQGECCPVSMLITDYISLPAKMKKALNEMFEFQTEWIQGILKAGQKQKSIRTDIPLPALTQLVVSASFGSQLVARINKTPQALRENKKNLLKLIANS